MSAPASHYVRAATATDVEPLLRLWALLFDDASASVTWMAHARQWFAGAVEDPYAARFPLIEVDGDVVATAIGTLELGVPNPHCPRGRTVRLANVITVPEHGGRASAPCSSATWSSGPGPSAPTGWISAPRQRGSASTSGSGSS